MRNSGVDISKLIKVINPEKGNQGDKKERI